MPRFLNTLDSGGVPFMAFPALAQFAREHPDPARELLKAWTSAPERFGRRLLLRFDRLVRGGYRNATLLAALEALHRVMDGNLRAAFVQAVAADAARATEERLATGRLRSLWGTTPILNIIPAAQADRLVGVEAETVVFTAYHITRDFDLVLKEQHEWILEVAPHLHGTYFWMVFVWALVSYDVFFYFNDRGVLLPTGGYGSDRFGINLEEMQLLNRARKRFYTLAYGADYRLRDKTLASGKFNFCMHCPEVGKFCLCDDAGGTRVLATIGSMATAMLGIGLSLDYLPDPRSLNYLVLDVTRFKPSYPQPRPGHPLRLVHAPNHPHFKGTHYLEAAVKRLQDEGYAIDLVMISGVSNREVRQILGDADVVVDQLIGGSFGYTAIEAMALGKPVICYVRDVSRVADPGRFPIVNANPDTLYDVLRDIVENPDGLKDAGHRARRYVEQHHSIEAFAGRLRRLYLDTAAFPKPIVRFLAEKPELLIRLERHARAAGHAISAHAMSLVRARRAARSAFRQVVRAWDASENIAARIAKDAWDLFFRTIAALRARAVKVAYDIAKASWHVVLLPVLIGIGRMATARRARAGKLTSVWGITPILTLPLLARCDRELGLESASLVYTTYYTRSDFDINLKQLSDRILARAPLLYTPFIRLALTYALVRFDVFHLFCDRGFLPPAGRIGIDPKELDILKRAGKRLYTYTYGADVRTRGPTLALGKFNFCMDCPEPGKYCICNEAAGAANVGAIERHATAMLAMGDMVAYLPRHREFHFWPIDTRGTAWPRSGATIRRPALRVAHAPNHPFFKGTVYLEAAIARLQAEGFPVELLRIGGVPNSEVLRLFGEADVVAEQFIGGFHGYTALEAMAAGKAVISYVRSPGLLIDADTCPIINATPDNLYQVLRDILGGKYDLAELGQRGRWYVERYYSIEAVAARLGRLYLETAGLPPRMASVIESNVARLERALPVAATPVPPDAPRRDFPAPVPLQ